MATVEPLRPRLATLEPEFDRFLPPDRIEAMFEAETWGVASIVAAPVVVGLAVTT